MKIYITTNPKKTFKNIIRKYYEEFYGFKFDNLGKGKKFLEDRNCQMACKKKYVI